MTENEKQNLSRKNDRKDNKPMWELLPLPMIEEVVKVFTMGAQKYGANTWQNLPDGYNRYKAALLRHLTAYDRGERKDAESGLSPLAHVAWNAIAMLYIAMREENGEQTEASTINVFEGGDETAWPKVMQGKK